MNKQQEKDDNKYNRKYAIDAMAKDILRNGPSLMTMKDAILEAERIYDHKQAQDE